MLTKDDLQKVPGANAQGGTVREQQYINTNPAQQAPVIPGGATPSYGWMQGVVAAKELQLSQNKDAQAQGYLNIANDESLRQQQAALNQNEKFGWDREDRNQQQFIQKGMGEAFQQGGYAGVIDFLGANDPEKALQFTKAKLSLDQDIMQNDVMRSIVPTKQAAALAEGYGVLGKMGYALLNAPAQDRANMYQHMLPVVKTINPAAPDSLDESAVNMFMLAAGQAMPASIQFDATKNSVTSQSAMGKLDVDIRSRLQHGETLENSPTLKGMVDEYQAYSTKAEQAALKLNQLSFDQQMQSVTAAKDQAQSNSAKYALVANMNSKLQTESKSFMALQDQKNIFEGAMTAIASGAGGAAQTAAYRNVAMMFNKGALSDPDVAAFANSDNTVQVALKKLNSVANDGGLVALNPSEIQRLRILVDNVYAKAQEKQNTINDRYKGMAAKYGVDPKDLSIYEPAAPPLYMDPSVPPELAAAAKAAISQGKPIDAVNAKIKSILGM